MAELNTSAGVEVGEVVDCTVEQIMPYGAFVRITKTGRKGMIHISELSYSFVKDINTVLKAQDKVQAKVIKIDEKGRIDLSLKQMQTPPERPSRPPRRPVQPQDTNGRPPKDYRSVTRENRGMRDFREMQSEYREANPEESDSFEKKMASFLKASEAKITDLNTRNSARSGRGGVRRRNGGRDY
ncbi:MAG: S1 RNA-binding domain-containing protein [Synergistaceae bacterium]|nr:S1 RNA-binding domain-containing protein [Synergistaceae bacterium]